MKKLLTVSAIFEVTVGILLLAVPDALAWVLLGSVPGTAAGVAVARFAGAALLSLGAACWFGSHDALSRAAFGIVAAMLLYNVAAVVLFLSFRNAGMNGIGLLPGAAVHAVMAVWCIYRLREG